MKKLVFLLIFANFVLVACTEATPEHIEGTINPGDEIDGMVFSTTDEIDWNNSLAFLCNFEHVDETTTTAIVPCSTLPGSRIFFGNCNGILFDTEEEAKKLWRDLKLEVTFDDQEINLPPFGYIDTDAYDQEKKYLRIWNLLVENITAGTHSIACKWEQDGESGTYTYNFTVSEEKETFPTLTAEVAPGIHPYTSEKATLNYLLYIPGEYNSNPELKWPLLLYLHGGDRVNSSVTLLENDFPLKPLKNQDYFPFIVITPKASGEHEFWATDEMDGAITILLNEVQGVLAVDPNRIYLTGVSAGGNGTWSIGLRHPEHFAALAPIMGYYGWPFTVPENICDLVGVPVWAFHGEKDEVIPLEAEQKLIDALEACGGNAQLTVFPNVGHDMNIEQIYSSDLYAWFLEQEKK